MRAIRARSLALALATLACAAPAAADGQSEALLRGFVEAIDRSPDWSASAALIRSDGASTVAEGLVFTRDEPRLSISAEQVRLVDLAARDGGGFTASEMEIAGGGLLSDQVDYSMPSLVATEVSMPSFLAVSFDPSRLMSSVAQAYTVAAQGAWEAVSIPELSGVQRAPAEPGGAPQESRFAYRQISLGAFRSGVVERLEAAPFTMTSGQPPSESAVTIERMFGERFDLGTLARIFDDSQYRNRRGDGIWRPLAGRVAYSGLSAKGPDGATARLAELTVEGVDGRQTFKPVATIWDRMLDPSVPEESKSDLALEALHLFSAWRVGTIRAQGLAVGAPQGGGSLSLDSATVTGLSDEGMDSLTLKSLRGQAPEGLFGLDGLEIAGLILPDPEGLTRFAALEKDAPAAEHAEAVESAFAALPRLSHFSLTGLVAGPNVAETVKLASFSLDFADWTRFFARSTDLRLEGLEVPRTLIQLDAQGNDVLDTLGLQRLAMAMSFSDRWAPDAGLDDATWRFAFQDLGTVELSYQLTGLTLDWVNEAIAAAGKAADSQAALTAMYNRLGLARAVLKVTDQSILDRAFAVAAKKQNLTVDGPTYRQQMRGALPFLLSAAVPAELSRLLSGPLQSFLAGGQTLVAEIAPPRPIPLPELAAAAEGDPMTIPTRLGLTLRTEAPQ